MEINGSGIGDKHTGSATLIVYYYKLNILLFKYRKYLFAKLRILKVHKRENFLGFDFEICTFS
jgi:hypothetical protein